MFESGWLNLLSYHITLVLLSMWGLLDVFFSNQGKTLRSGSNAGWDFNVGGSTSTGTVRSAIKPPQARDKKPEVPQPTSKRTLESGNWWTSAARSALNDSSEVSVERDTRDPRLDDREDVSFLCIYIYTIYDKREQRVFGIYTKLPNYSSRALNYYKNNAIKRI